MLRPHLIVIEFYFRCIVGISRILGLRVMVVGGLGLELREEWVGGTLSMSRFRVSTFFVSVV